jgi:hypothetical protein
LEFAAYAFVCVPVAIVQVSASPLDCDYLVDNDRSRVVCALHSYDMFRRSDRIGRGLDSEHTGLVNGHCTDTVPDIVALASTPAGRTVGSRTRYIHSRNQSEGYYTCCFAQLAAEEVLVEAEAGLGTVEDQVDCRTDAVSADVAAAIAGEYHSWPSFKCGVRFAIEEGSG